MITPSVNITLNSTEGSWSGIPVVTDIYNATAIVVKWIPQDIHYPNTTRNNFTQNLYIYSNRAPYNVSSIANQSYDAGYNWTFTFADNLFADDDQEPVAIFTFGSNPDASGWLTLDSDTRTFSGVPSVNDDALNYTISLYGDDNNTNSGKGTIDFYLEIIPN